jgi:hypothetical protein
MVPGSALLADGMPSSESGAGSGATFSCPPKSLNDSCSGSWARSETVAALSWRDPRTVVPPKVMRTERSVDTDASSIRAGASAVEVVNGDGGAVVAVDGDAFVLLPGNGAASSAPAQPDRTRIATSTVPP